MKRYCLALDLHDDQLMIQEYKRHHESVWPEVKTSILSTGVTDMEIYLVGNRLFMIMEVSDEFSFEAKAAADAANNTVQQWEKLMGKYQVVLPQAKAGEKWVVTDRVFSLTRK